MPEGKPAGVRCVVLDDGEEVRPRVVISTLDAPATLLRLVGGRQVPGRLGNRASGVLIANGKGKALAYALFNLQDRGRLFLGHGEEVYEGMIVGLHSRDNDLVVNPTKAKQLTNIRAAGSDENILLTPPVRHSLEQAMEFIADDELVEVTPSTIRIRKKYLTENERKRMSRGTAARG